MQTMPPVFVAAVPLVERPQADLAIQGVTQSGSSSANGEADNPDARDPALASDRAREVTRLLNGVPIEEEQLIPGFPPLDTREVGDRDIIDPNRPSVRGPEPLAEGDTPEALPPLPDEVDPTKAEGSEEVEAAAQPELPGMPEQDREGEPAETTGSDDPQATTQTPKVAAQPASPGASAPDVPEPPAPGTVDIRR